MWHKHIRLDIILEASLLYEFIFKMSYLLSKLHGNHVENILRKEKGFSEDLGRTFLRGFFNFHVLGEYGGRKRKK